MDASRRPPLLEPTGVTIGPSHITAGRGKRMVEALVAKAEAGTEYEARRLKLSETAAWKEMHERREEQAKRQ